VRAEILGVGTELLLGQIANTNAAWISERLARIGVDRAASRRRSATVERIAEAIHLGAARADVLIATGGLGPTQDDVTRQGLAAAAGVPLRRDPGIEERLRARWAATGREMPASNLVQADVPEGGREIAPERGTAPGLVVDVDGRRVYALPRPGRDARDDDRHRPTELAALARPRSSRASCGAWGCRVQDRRALDDRFEAPRTRRSRISPAVVRYGCG
jgi:nicotinamide-nucleotide amidase